MLRPILTGLVLAAASLLAACGGGDKQAETPAEPEVTTAEPAAPSSQRPVSFGLCAMCHSDEPGKNGLGPSLFGVVGRQAGTGPGYSYSPAMQDANLTWDEATIDRYIQKPREVIPGTKMSYAGLNDPKKRAEIISYLETLN